MLARSLDGKRSGLTRPLRMGPAKVSGVQHVSTLLCMYLPRADDIASVGQKTYSKQTVYDAHLTSKKHIKATQKQASSPEQPPANPNGPTQSAPPQNGHEASQASAKARHRNAALFTYLCTQLLSSLAPVLSDTKSNVERRFSLTAREREQELLEQSKPQPAAAAPANGDAGGEEEEEEERIYNPLKLPLGWDGKPIPYWLYKLHGLGVEYRCEICSDHVYMGRSVAPCRTCSFAMLTTPVCQEKLRSSLPSESHMCTVSELLLTDQ